MYNTILYFVVAFLIMLTVVLVLFIRAVILTRSTVTPQKVKDSPKEHLGESEERMMEDKEEVKAIDAGEGEEDTEDDKNKHKRNKDPEDEPEEEEVKQPTRKNNDPVDEDEEDANPEDELEDELDKIE